MRTTSLTSLESLEPRRLFAAAAPLTANQLAAVEAVVSELTMVNYVAMQQIIAAARFNARVAQSATDIDNLLDLTASPANADGDIASAAGVAFASSAFSDTLISY